MTLELLSEQRKPLMGFATLYIMLFHVTTMLPQKSISIFDMGNVGVEIFLLLSGIGIYQSLSKKDQTLRNFYISRSRRIVLPYLLITIPFTLYSYVKGDLTGYHLAFRFSGLTALFEGSKWLWYTTIALFCYMLAPLFKKFVDFNKPLLTTASVLALFYIISRLNQRSEIMWTRIPIFYFGMVLGRFYREDAPFHVHPITGFTLLLLTFCVSHYLYHYGVFEHRSKTIMRLALAMYSLPLSFCVAYISKNLPSLFQNLLGWFGQYSFELYIIHIAVMLYFFNDMTNLWVYSITIFCISVPMAFVLSKTCQFIYAKLMGI